MGEVVAFQIREKTARERSGPPSGGAQILFFLGVRYARIEEPQDALTPDQGQGHGHGPRGGKKRKSRARA
ncbi:hypothetical protein [Methylocystis parvus]|uniref:Uncharacterized protein n=1 Tax=Methylocystis parvus TaxID=134 RepID=A0A6B8MCI9_9HYPH|nr:hypothetical protein [Methylocystis parvus]QGM98370.1 hypothetical protein F7D14_13375 [Methylocystis parvus]WBK01299.1 hypothetical protein MMG94_06195 [Methylocystis parvus OBBP]